MSRFTYYGSGQRLGFGLLLIGFCVCVIGGIAPYWLEAEIKISDILSVSNYLSGIKGLEINVGIWWYCMDFAGIEKKCENMYLSDTTNVHLTLRDGTTDDGNAWITFARFMMAVNWKLSLICGLVACCRCACCSGGRTILHGVFAFLAGACGFAVVGIMSDRKDSLLALPLVNLTYSWAFGLYIVGCCALIASSLLLCFSLPRQPNNGQVLYPSGPMPTAIITQSSVHQYELNGQIQTFEPLPGPNVIQHQA